MSIKKVCAVVFTLLALGAISATSSSAAVETVRAEFTKGPTPGATLQEELSVTASLGTHPVIGKKATFAFMTGGTAFDLVAEEVECVECKFLNNEVTGSPGIAYGEGRLKFKKVSVTAPENCTVKGEAGTSVGEIITKPLVMHADFMDTNGANLKGFIQYIPKAGSGKTFAELSLSGTGCEAFEGTKNVLGTLFAESVNTTGSFSKTQGVVFGQAVQETAGGSLNVEGGPASLTATVNYSAGETELAIKAEPLGGVKTARAEFYKGPTPGTTLSEDLSVTASLGSHPIIGKKVTFSFAISGQLIDFTAEEVECVGCKITNKEVTGTAGAIAFGEGKLRFKNATVMQPAGCKIESEAGVAGEVITRQLIFHGDFMDTNSSNQRAFVQFIPAAGPGTAFAIYTVANAAGEVCPIAGTTSLVGSIFGGSLNNTGVFSKTQALIFGPSIQETAGGSLSVGGRAATLTMTINYSVVGGTEYTIK
jgi:hypothetical protein